ncbi:hypothetical protein CYMTET_20662 [Cymbomonas tetramitiformis]|uniref:HD domain-containing protein n=1 Tax=Cymbomonas tetramitiformis TaxID=36881 RepID=A0AAE0EY14_9CHLO|nr:hypothetical protein CYMTET_45994 [Cymbomonas tetramitiformis]KAK3270968.1 hypothetical protein CYMTET_20662 [Cymbomonas tetramitiformis]|eukprot:gene3724-4665_t
MYTHFDKWKQKLRRPELVELAIFFHDVIYEGTAKEDELKSADVYRTFAEEAGQPEADVELVYRWIVATATHAVVEEDTYDGYFFMDFDMAILGVDQTQYTAYVQSVKEEYMNLKGYQKIPFVWEVMWCWGRPKAMSNFLKVPNIYSTKEFQTNLESRARENLQEEIGKLLFHRNLFLAICTVFGVIVTGLALKCAATVWF